MTLLSRIRNAWRALTSGNPLGAVKGISYRAIPLGRTSHDSSDTLTFSGWIVQAPVDYESNWRLLNLDAKTLDRVTPSRLLEMLADLSPEVSKALWDFLRLCNPGYEITATQPGSESENTQAQEAIDAFLDTLADEYGTADIVWGRLYMSAFLRGALCAELVLDRGRMPVDIATPDPGSIRFRKRKDPVRGEVWQPGQWQAGKFVVLDMPTFRYTPVDPHLTTPYGRPLAASALFTSLFLLGMLHDLRRVVQQQGYPRLDLSISTEAVRNANMEMTDDDFSTAITAIVNDVQTAYAQLEPDDAYIHTDTITVNRPVGTVDASSLGAIDGLITALERMATRALKSMPLMLGITESTTETHANRQFELFSAGIRSIQHYAETMLERLFTLALEAQGIQADVQFRFAELRASERLRDAQAEGMEIENERKKYEQGWTSQDEGANAVTGHDAEEDEPRQQAGGFQFLQGDGDGMERMPAMRYRNIAGERVKLIPDGADDPLTPVPDTVEISDADEERALDDWDELMPDEAGLLDATVEGQTDFDIPRAWIALPGTEMEVHIRRQRDPSPWVWSQSSKRYRNTETGRFIGQRQMTQLRDQFVDAKRVVADTLGTRLGSGDLTIQQWELEMRRHIKSTFVDQYVLGKGGRNNMTPADWGRTGRMIRSQYEFLHSFAQDIADGNLSQAQIEARGRQYFNSATQAFERGRTASYGVPSLPEYPADGSQICRSNCRCRWSIVETEEVWECTWLLDAAAEHCETCAGNAARWAPLTIGKAGRSREQVKEYLETLTNGHR